MCGSTTWGPLYIERPGQIDMPRLLKVMESPVIMVVVVVVVPLFIIFIIYYYCMIVVLICFYYHDDACYSWYSCYCYCKLRCDPLLLIILTRSHPCPKHVRMVDQATTCERVLQCPAGDSPLPLNMPILGQDYGPDTKPVSMLVSVKHWGRDY